MVRRSAFCTALVLLSATLAQAQRQPSQLPRQTTELVIKVTYENDRAVPEQVRIQLTNGSGIPVTETYTRGEGEARFQNIEPGTYRIRASGVDIEERMSDSSFVINPRELTHMEFFQVRRKPNGNPTSRDGSVSAAVLNIPTKAESEFDKGVVALKKQNLDEAEKRFVKAAEMYPKYAAAFNNLGVIAMQRGNPQEGKSFFSQAVKADEQYAPSYLNLAKSYIGVKEYPPAMQLLTKANSIEPNNLEVLALLTMLEYDSSQMSSALGHARKIHGMAGHEKFAFAHYIAGKALESQNQGQDALVEYRLFLKEAPQSPTAGKVQASIDAIEKQKR
jgi:tetratricopeptide (TPR) repeat protein